MKKILALLLLLSLMSCEKQDSVGACVADVTKSESEFETVSKYAVDESDLMSFLRITYPEKEVKSIARCGSAYGYYAVDFDKGCVIISRDRRLDPILIEDMNTQSLDLLTIPAVKGMLSVLLSERDEDNLLAGQSCLDLWNFILNKGYVSCSKPEIDTKIYGGQWWTKVFLAESSRRISIYPALPHLMNTEWGQDVVWRGSCPTDVGPSGDLRLCPPGCGAVAASQILYYWNRKTGLPSSLEEEISFSGLDRSHRIAGYSSNLVENSLRWDLMALDSTETHIDYVSDFMLEVGHNYQTRYFVNGSFTSIENLPELMNHYGFTCSLSEMNGASLDIVLDNLNQSKPVYVRGTSATGGHAWVIDGYETWATEFEMTYKWVKGMIPATSDYDQYISEYNLNSMGILPGYYPVDGEISIERYRYEENKLKCNLGWSGDGNNASYSPFLVVQSGQSFGGFTDIRIGYDISPIVHEE